MDFLAELTRIAEECPEYPSLTHPELPRGFSVGIPGLEERVPVEVLRKAVLADVKLMATIVLDMDLEDFHIRWLNWCFTHPQSAIEAPRGFGKSTICTTLFAITMICRNFDVRILITSERDDQVKGFLSEIRGHLESNDTLKMLFGEFEGKGKWTDHKLVIGQRRNHAAKESTVDALQMGGAVTGRHWEVIIVDDPTSQNSAWSETKRDKSFLYYFSTLKPCLMPGGYLQVRATRYHFEDLLGRLEREIALDHTTGESFVYHVEDSSIPVIRSARMKVLKTSAIDRDGRSIWESRNPLRDRINTDGTVVEGLISLKKDMGARAFGEQYQMVCNEPPKKGERETECREEWLPVWTRKPDVRRLKIVIRVDPAWTSAEKAAQKHVKDRKPDWSAIAAYGFDRSARKGEARYYVMALEAGLWSTGELSKRIRDFANTWAMRAGVTSLRIGVERTGLQIRQAPKFYKDLRDQLKPHKTVWINPRINKLAHARPFFVSAEAGEVRISPDVEVSGFVQMCGDFPFGDRDDEIDAVAGAHRMVQRRTTDLRDISQRGKSDKKLTSIAARGMSGGQAW